MLGSAAASVGPGSRSAVRSFATSAVATGEAALPLYGAARLPVGAKAPNPKRLFPLLHRTMALTFAWDTVKAAANL